MWLNCILFFLFTCLQFFSYTQNNYTPRWQIGDEYEVIKKEKISYFFSDSIHNTHHVEHTFKLKVLKENAAFFVVEYIDLGEALTSFDFYENTDSLAINDSIENVLESLFSVLSSASENLKDITLKFLISKKTGEAKKIINFNEVSELTNEYLEIFYKKLDDTTSFKIPYTVKFKIKEEVKQIFKNKKKEIKETYLNQMNLCLAPYTCYFDENEVLEYEVDLDNVNKLDGDFTMRGTFRVTTNLTSSKLTIRAYLIDYDEEYLVHYFNDLVNKEPVAVAKEGETSYLMKENMIINTKTSWVISSEIIESAQLGDLKIDNTTTFRFKSML